MEKSLETNGEGKVAVAAPPAKSVQTSDKGHPIALVDKAIIAIATLYALFGRIFLFALFTALLTMFWMAVLFPLFILVAALGTSGWILLLVVSVALSVTTWLR
jgi:hypothetical protein